MPAFVVSRRFPVKRMLINAIDPEESRIAAVEDGVLQELHVELANREAYLGNIYKGKVVNIEPSIGAAFVAFGGRVNGFLHVSDVLPAYGRPDFRLEDVIEGRARVDVDDGPESMQQALADDEDEGNGDTNGDLAPRTADEGQSDAESADAGMVETVAMSEGDDEVVEVEATPFDTRDDDAQEEGAPNEDDSDEDDEGDDSSSEEDDDSSDDDDDDDDGDDGFGGGLGERPLPMAASGEAGSEAGGESSGGDATDSGPAAGSGGGESAGETAPAGGQAPAEGQRGGERRGRRGRRGGRDGRDGRKEQRARPARMTIDQLLRKGQEVVVQITKEGIGTKGPTLTTYVSLPGRCLVLMPSLPKCGVSRKIEDGRERKRLKRIVNALDETGHGGIGFIVRTAGINKSLEDLQRDRDYLKRIWELVAQRLQVTRAPSLLYQESDLVLKAMRDQFTPDIAEVVVDSEDVFLRIRDFAEKLMPHMSERIKQHSMTTPLFHHFGIEKEVEALYQPRVDLPNGASIVIDQTEALVAIDVNSGKYKAGGDTDETAYRTNLDAIPEIVRQLRLRDLGGLIIIDFIDMSQEKQRRGVERRLVEALRGDRARIKVGRISPFGMLEITRQRVGPGLKRTVFMQCPHCKGAGWSRTVQSKALSVLRESRALVNLKGFSVLQVFVAPAVADYLVNYKRRGVLELEDAVGKSIVFKPETSYPIDVVHYRFLTGDGQEARIAIPAGLGVKA
jgi:ribonuclease E